MIRIVIISFLLLPLKLAGQVRPLINAHSHNDYLHKEPLIDALALGFISVEADIYLIDGELYVSHDKPVIKDPSRTLEALYLEPLYRRTLQHEDRIYDKYYDYFYLMIDVKTEGQSTCKVLEEQLKKYSSIIPAVRKKVEEQGKPVKVFLSGNRTGLPADKILAGKNQFISLDGRPEELGKNIPSSLMPVISEDYSKFLTWKGTGPVKPDEEKRLIEFVMQAHSEFKKTRLWGAPDIPEIWGYLLDKGVDLINTDKLDELADYLRNREKK